jgi:hypothetical protein
MIDLDGVLRELSKERPVFHSEADFQHALAWKIHEKHPEMNIRLERRIELDDKEIYVDIFLKDKEERIGLIELKYKTRDIEIEVNDERFKLKDQSAQDISRYDFIKDVSRLEECVDKLPNAIGYAIFLTNDPSYWNLPRTTNTIDKDFRIHDGRVVQGTLRWKEGTSKGTMEGREEPIVLKGKYRLTWKDYSNFGMKYGMLRYLLVTIEEV